MTDADIVAGIRDVARRHLKVDREIGMETSLVEALALDSLRMLTLVAVNRMSSSSVTTSSDGWGCGWAIGSRSGSGAR